MWDSDTGHCHCCLTDVHFTSRHCPKAEAKAGDTPDPWAGLSVITMAPARNPISLQSQRIKSRHCSRIQSTHVRPDLHFANRCCPLSSAWGVRPAESHRLPPASGPRLGFAVTRIGQPVCCVPELWKCSPCLNVSQSLCSGDRILSAAHGEQCLERLTSVKLWIISKLVTFSSHFSRRLPASGFTQSHTLPGVPSTMPSPRYLQHRKGFDPEISSIRPVYPGALDKD